MCYKGHTKIQNAMPKSKNRKKHAQKVQQFHNRVAQERNEVNRMERSFMNRLLDYNENARKEALVGKLYHARPELVVEQNDSFVLNEELIESKDDILVWKDTQVSILDGYEELERAPVYQIPVMNLILGKLYHHVQKVKTEREAAASGESVEGSVTVASVFGVEALPGTPEPQPAEWVELTSGTSEA